MEPGPADALPRADVVEASNELNGALASREREYERERRNRWRFGAGFVLLSLAAALGALLVARGFDRQVFTANLMDRLQGRAPEVMDRLKKTAAQLGPVYRSEIQRSLPAFQDALAKAIRDEAGKAGTLLTPIITQDPALLTREADARLAKALQEAFPAELRDGAKALALARALRAQQLKPWPAGTPGDMGAPFVVLRQIQDALRGMGPPDDESLLRGDMADALWRTAFDVVKAKIATGDVLGAEPKASAKDAKKPAPAADAKKGD